jgi:molybdenum cofactor cytidylyltransferase
MPEVSGKIIDQLIAAFNPEENRLICVPVYQGQRGNPVVLARRFFSEMYELSGDKGAREFLDQYADLVCEVEVNDESILHDIDISETLLRYNSANV